MRYITLSTLTLILLSGFVAAQTTPTPTATPRALELILPVDLQTLALTQEDTRDVVGWNALNNDPMNAGVLRSLSNGINSEAPFNPNAGGLPVYQPVVFSWHRPHWDHPDTAAPEVKTGFHYPDSWYFFAYGLRAATDDAVWSSTVAGGVVRGATSYFNVSAELGDCSEASCVPRILEDNDKKPVQGTDAFFWLINSASNEVPLDRDNLMGNDAMNNSANIVDPNNVALADFAQSSYTLVALPQAEPSGAKRVPGLLASAGLAGSGAMEEAQWPNMESGLYRWGVSSIDIENPSPDFVARSVPRTFIIDNSVPTMASGAVNPAEAFSGEDFRLTTTSTGVEVTWNNNERAIHRAFTKPLSAGETLRYLSWSTNTDRTLTLRLRDDIDVDEDETLASTRTTAVRDGTSIKADFLVVDAITEGLPREVDEIRLNPAQAAIGDGSYVIAVEPHDAAVAVSLTAEGTPTVNVSGNIGRVAQAAFVVDNSIPTVAVSAENANPQSGADPEIVGGADSAAEYSTARITLTATDPDIGTVGGAGIDIDTIQVDVSQLNSGISPLGVLSPFLISGVTDTNFEGVYTFVWVIPVTTTTSGQSQVTADAADAVGNSAAPASDTITVDNEDPQITAFSVVNDNPQAGADPEIVGGPGSDSIRSNARISMTVTDAISGVDVNTIQVEINGLVAGDQTLTAADADTPPTGNFASSYSLVWTVPVTEPVSGLKTITADAADAVGNSDQASDTITVDNDDPQITAFSVVNSNPQAGADPDIVGGPDSDASRSSARISMIVTDAISGVDVNTIQVEINGLVTGDRILTATDADTPPTGNFASSYSLVWTVPVTEPVSGLKTITADAADAVGNSAAQASDTITVDNDDPQITLFTVVNENAKSGADTEIVGGLDAGRRTATIRMTVTDAISGVDVNSIRVDLSGLLEPDEVWGASRAVTPPTGNFAPSYSLVWTVPVTETVSGLKTITADASDTVGNAAAQDSDTIIVDNIEPTVDDFSVVSVNWQVNEEIVGGANAASTYNTARITLTVSDPDVGTGGGGTILGAGIDVNTIQIVIDQLVPGQAPLSATQADSPPSDNFAIQYTLVWTLDVTANTSGLKTITANVSDGVDHATSDTDTITVDNDSPTASLPVVRGASPEGIHGFVSTSTNAYVLLLGVQDNTSGIVVNHDDLDSNLRWPAVDMRDLVRGAPAWETVVGATGISGATYSVATSPTLTTLPTILPSGQPLDVTWSLNAGNVEVQGGPVSVRSVTASNIIDAVGIPASAPTAATFVLDNLAPVADVSSATVSLIDPFAVFTSDMCPSHPFQWTTCVTGVYQVTGVAMNLRFLEADFDGEPQVGINVASARLNWATNTQNPSAGGGGLLWGSTPVNMQVETVEVDASGRRVTAAIAQIRLTTAEMVMGATLSAPELYSFNLTVQDRLGNATETVIVVNILSTTQAEILDILGGQLPQPPPTVPVVARQWTRWQQLFFLSTQWNGFSDFERPGTLADTNQAGAPSRRDLFDLLGNWRE